MVYMVTFPQKSSPSALFDITILCSPQKTKYYIPLHHDISTYHFAVFEGRVFLYDVTDWWLCTSHPTLTSGESVQHKGTQVSTLLLLYFLLAWCRCLHHARPVCPSLCRWHRCCNSGLSLDVFAFSGSFGQQVGVPETSYDLSVFASMKPMGLKT